MKRTASVMVFVLTMVAATATTMAAIPTPVAYWPMRDGMPGDTVTGADDVIDDASHPAADATINNANATWVADPLRGIVFSTVEGNRLTAGQQGINLNTQSGWTWSIWAKVDSSNVNDPGADCLMGTRAGPWNKMDRTGCSNWINPTYPDMADDTWHHWVFVGDETGGSVYRDGELQSKDTTFNHTGGALATDIEALKLEIGGTSQYSEDITGLISDVAVWTIALTESQILELYNGSNVTTDTTAPFLAATTPVDDDGNAATAFLQAIFDEPVVVGSGNILIINDTDGTTNTIAVTDDTQVTVSGAAIVIEPTTALLVGKAYHVEMGVGVAKNIEGIDFGGIGDATTWNFTSDDTPPALVSMEDNIGGGPAGEDLIEFSYTVTFNEPMDSSTITTSAFDNAGTAAISIGSVTEVSPTAFTVAVYPFSTGTIQLQIPTGAVVTDASGNALAVPVVDDNTITINAGRSPVAGTLYWDGATTNGATDGVSQGGNGTWDQATTRWDMGYGYSGPFAWDNSADASAVIGGAGSTLSLTEDINVKDITLENINADITITGQTLNFSENSTITTLLEDYNRNYTISSDITGAPDIRVNSSDQNKQLTFDSPGDQELGVLTNPFYDGVDGDKARVNLRGSSHGNTLKGANYINTNPDTGTSRNCHYGYLYKEGTGTWTINGDVEQGRIFTQGGTLIINGKFTSLYQGFGAAIPSGFKLGGQLDYYMSDARFGRLTLGSGAIVAPGNPAVSNGVGRITLEAQENRADAWYLEMQAGSIYEWQVGANATDVIHMMRNSRDRSINIGDITLKIMDAGGEPAASDKLPVFTYDAGVTRSIGTVTFDTSEANPGWSTDALSLVDDDTGMIYLTGLSSAPSGTTLLVK